MDGYRRKKRLVYLPGGPARYYFVVVRLVPFRFVPGCLTAGPGIPQHIFLGTSEKAGVPAYCACLK